MPLPSIVGYLSALFILTAKKYSIKSIFVLMLLLGQSAIALETSALRDSPYYAARKQLIKQGWKPIERNKGWRMSANKAVDEKLRTAGVAEFYGCNGIGYNLCYFCFKNKQGVMLQVVVLGGNSPGLNSKVIDLNQVSAIQEFDF